MSQESIILLLKRVAGTAKKTDIFNLSIFLVVIFNAAFIRPFHHFWKGDKCELAELSHSKKYSEFCRHRIHFFFK